MTTTEAEDRKTIVVDTKQDILDLAEDETVRLDGLRKIPSEASLSALHPVSPSTTVATPITPSLTTGASVATDDEEGDYQSAYSTSPRGSYGSFENFTVQTEASDSDLGTPTTIAKEYVVDLEPSYRDRASSTSTAKGPKSRYRISEDTVVTSPIGSI